MGKSIDWVFQSLLPKDKKFYPLFERQCQNLVECSNEFESSLKSDSVTRFKLIERINVYEKNGDEIKSAISKCLAQDFIVPFDRDDIQNLSISIDEIVNVMYAITKRIDLYKIYEISDSMKRLSEIINESCIEIKYIVEKMKDIRNSKLLFSNIKKLDELESEADHIRDLEVARLFKYEKDVTNLIKTKEIITLLEEVTNCCQDVGDIVQSILIKNS